MQLLIMGIYSILLDISIFSLLPPIFIGVYRLRILSREMKFFVLYLIIALIIALIVNRIAVDQWTMEIMHMNTLIEYFFIMFIISSLQESQTIKRFMKILFWSYMLFWLIAKLTFEPISGLYSITLSISQVILALSAGYTLFVVIGNHTQPLHRYQLFWVLIALVLNYTGTLIPIALGNVFFTQPGEAMILIYCITWVLAIFSNILITIGFLCPPTQQSLSL
jgi:hypothetical protein